MHTDPSLTLLYDFAGRKSLDATLGLGPTLGIVRNSTATYYDANGILQTATLGEARFDHDPVTGASLGLLVEEFRSNICVQSEDLSTTWVKITTQDSINATAAPDGTISADRILDDNLGGSAANGYQQPVTVNINTAHAYSVYLKADQLDWGWLRVASLGTLDINAYFDLANGVVGATVGADVDSTFIEDVGNGWYRCSITFTTDGSDTTGNAYVYVADADNDNVTARDGTSSIFAWGAQLEAGAFPTSYIKTTTAVATRVADFISSPDVSWLDTAVGSIFVKSAFLSPVTNASVLFDISDGTTANRITPYISSTGQHRFFITDTSVIQSDIGGAVVANKVTSIVASAWALNDIAMYQDGSAKTPDVAATIPTGLTEFSVGKNGADVQVYSGHIAEVRYYDERKPNQFLEDLSNNLIPYQLVDELTLHYNFAKSVSLEPANGVGITCPFSRATIATFKDWENILRTVPSGEPRFTGCRRVENLALQSEDFSTTWVVNAVDATITVNSDIAPDGALTGDRIAIKTGSGHNNCYVSQGITVPAAGVYTFSCYFNSGNNTGWVVLQALNFGATSRHAFFDLSGEGAVGTILGSPDDTAIESVGNNWYRCSITVNIAAGDLIGTMRIWAADSDVVTSITTTDGSAWLGVWGAQIERVDGQVDKLPSDYLLTTTAAAVQRFATYKTPGLRTNICLQSEDFTAFGWTTNPHGITTVDQAIAPDGTMTADALNAAGLVTQSQVKINRNLLPLEPSTPYLAECYFKANTENWAIVQITGQPGQSIWKYFDLANGVVASGGGDETSGLIESVGNGWYRCAVGFLSDAVDTAADIVLWTSTGDNLTVFPALATTGIYLWGAQVEIASHGDVAVPSTYIPTVAAAVSAAVGNPQDNTPLPNIRGLLIEEARTNEALWSEDFSNVAWTKTTMTVAAGVGIAPDGSSNVTKLTATGANSVIEQIITNASLPYIAGFFIRRITGSGVVEVSADGTGWTAAALTTEWQLFSDLTITANCRAALRIVTSGDEVEVWGGTLEQMSGSSAVDVPLSYQKTIGATATRDKDDTLSTDVTWFNSAAGTFYMACDWYDVTDVVHVFHMTSSPSAADDEIRMRMASFSTPNWLTRRATTFQVSITASVAKVDNVLVQSAFAYQLNDAVAGYDGLLEPADTSGALPIGLDRWRFGDNVVSSVGSTLNGHVAEFRYYNTRLPDAVVQSLSAGNFGAAGGLGFSRSLSRPLSRGISRAHGG